MCLIIGVSVTILVGDYIEIFEFKDIFVGYAFILIRVLFVLPSVVVCVVMADSFVRHARH
jgi:ABC-type phosphate transport system permease subunit